MYLPSVIGDAELTKALDGGVEDSIQRVFYVVLQESLNRTGFTLKISTY